MSKLAKHALAPRSTGRGVTATFLLTLVSGCMSHMMDEMGGPPEVIDVPPTEGQFETDAAPDLDPADDVVEVELEAKASEVEVAPGHRVRMWTYNGSLPGPRIESSR